MSQILFSFLNQTMDSQCPLIAADQEVLDHLEPTIPPNLIIGGLVLAGSLVTALVSRCLYRRCSSTLQSRTAQLVRDCQGHNSQLTPIGKTVHAFIESNWAAIISGNPCLNSEKNKTALYENLLYVITANQPLELKIQICQNVIQNFKTSNEKAISRIQNDLDLDPEFRTLFGIQEDATIHKLTRLGEETHHKGNVPFEVEFSDGVKVVYKPRSMVSERAICSHVGSYFSELQQEGRDLGTYRILDRGEYGYAEFLENRQEENTYDHPEEMREFAARLATLDLFANAIELTDLHNGNVAIVKKRVFAIDTEVVMAPGIKELPFDTMALRWGRSVPAWFPEKKTINKVFWKEDKAVDLGNRDCTFFKEMIEDEVRKCAPMSSKEKAIASKCRDVLIDRKHRFVLIQTQTLDGLIKKVPDERTKQELFDLLDDRMSLHGFTLDESKKEAIWEKFKEDLLNNDIPVFFFHPASNTMFYDDLPIGQKESLIRFNYRGENPAFLAATKTTLSDRGPRHH